MIARKAKYYLNKALDLRPGDLVLAYYTAPAQGDQVPHRKLQVKWTGPHVVLRVVNQTMVQQGTLRGRIGCTGRGTHISWSMEARYVSYEGRTTLLPPDQRGPSPPSPRTSWRSSRRTWRVLRSPSHRHSPQGGGGSGEQPGGKKKEPHPPSWFPHPRGSRAPEEELPLCNKIWFICFLFFQRRKKRRGKTWFINLLQKLVFYKTMLTKKSERETDCFAKVLNPGWEGVNLRHSPNFLRIGTTPSNVRPLSK